MQILKYVQSLLPRLQKNHLTEELRVTLKELQDEVSPVYKSLADVFKVKKPTSKEVEELNKLFTRNFKGVGGRQPNLIADIANALDNVIDNAKYLRESVEEVIENDIITDGLTAKKAILIRSVEHMSFISRFSMDLANYVLTSEQLSMRPDLKDSIDLTPADRKKVERDIARFASMLSDYCVDPKDYKKLVELTPDVAIGSRSAKAIQGLYKEKEIDPMFNPYVAGFTYNPFLHVQMAINQWQDRRYRSNKAKREALELRMLQLKLQREEKSTPKLESEIRYNQSRLDKLTAELREEEEAAGVEA